MKIKKQIKKIFFAILVIEFILIGLNFGMIVEKMSYDICGSACRVKNVSNQKKTKVRQNYQDSIYISKINVKAPIIFNSGLNEDAIADNLTKGVVYYAGSSLPGEERGLSVLLGHSSNYWWVKSDYNNVFALIPELKDGDEINIYYQNIKYDYRVASNKIINPSEWEQIKNPAIESGLALITCWPLGSALKRYVVFAQRIN